ncbi:MAG: hypothetical protein WCP20_11860 [Desulfuromonadales bacterium]
MKQKPIDIKPIHGRPPLEFNQIYADRLCAEISTCPESLASIVRRLQSEYRDFPSVMTLYKWLRENESFANQYADAKCNQSDILVDSLLDIADDDSGDADGSVSVQRAKLRTDVRKWIASKLKPKAYGDRLDVMATLDHSLSISSLLKSIPAPRLIPNEPAEATHIE